MSDTKLTVGQAIDQVTEALKSFDIHAQNTILSTVCALLKIKKPEGLQDHSGEIPPPPDPARKLDTAPREQQRKSDLIDIKTLKTEKKPNSAREMACIVAYYLSECVPESERRNTISSGDIEKYFKQAGYRLPESLQQLLPDSKKAGYFEGAARGEYRLTRVGYNLVAHNLPGKSPA